MNAYSLDQKLICVVTAYSLVITKSLIELLSFDSHGF